MKTLQYIKRFKVEASVFAINQFITILSVLFDTNSFAVIYRYLTFEPIRTATDMVAKENNLTTFAYLLNYSLSIGKPFDVVVIWGTFIFQLILPFIATIGVFRFYKRHIGINKLIYYRKQNYIRSIRKLALNESLRISLSVFLAYLTFLVFYRLVGTNPVQELYSVGAMPRTLFLDWFGNSFYYDYPFLYWSLEGLVRFWLVPFIYCYCACLLSVVVLSAKKSYLIVNLYYIIASAIFGAISLIGLPFHLDLYLNPSVILASGSYDLKTLPLLLGTILPIVWAEIFYYKNRRLLYD